MSGSDPRERLIAALDVPSADAARALADTSMGAEEIARKAMAIAAEICVYTNTNVVLEALDSSK